MQYLLNIFRHYICILLTLCIGSNASSQELGEFDVRSGVGPFRLGSARSQLDSSIVLSEAGKMEYKGRTEYYYSYPAVTDRPYLLDGIRFNNLLLTYISDTLVRILLTKIYTPRLYPDYSKRAKQEFRQLSRYLQRQWNDPGKKKTFQQSPDKRIHSEGLQWNTDLATMRIELYEDKGKANRQYLVSVSLDLPGYD